MSKKIWVLVLLIAIISPTVAVYSETLFGYVKSFYITTDYEINSYVLLDNTKPITDLNGNSLSTIDKLTIPPSLYQNNDLLCLLATAKSNNWGVKFEISQDTVVSYIIAIETPSFLSLVPKNELVAEYLFNNNASDTSGNDINGDFAGVTWTADRFGNEGSASFYDGTGDHISIPFNSDNFANIANEFSISIWINQPVVSSQICIISKGDVPVHNTQASWGIFSMNRLNIYRLKDDNYTAEYNIYDIPPDEWVHIVITFNINTEEVRVYKNSVFIKSWAKTTPIYFDNENIYIGAQRWNGDLGYFFQGKIDDIRIYNRQLLEDEIQVLYNENGWN